MRRLSPTDVRATERAERGSGRKNNSMHSDTMLEKSSLRERFIVEDIRPASRSFCRGLFILSLRHISRRRRVMRAGVGGGGMRMTVLASLAEFYENPPRSRFYGGANLLKIRNGARH